MHTSIDAYINECSSSTDRAPSVIEKLGTQSSSNRSNNGFVLAPVSPIKMNLDDLESSDIGRDPKFMNGGWLGIAIFIAGAVYLGFISIWATLALTVVWWVI